VNAAIDRGIEQLQAAIYVVAEILPRMFHALANLRIGREMHHPRHAFERARELYMVRKISFDEFKTFRQEAVASREVIVKDGVVAMAAQSMRGVAADVACSANY